VPNSTGVGQNNIEPVSATATQFGFYLQNGPVALGLLMLYFLPTIVSPQKLAFHIKPRAHWPSSVRVSFELKRQREKKKKKKKKTNLEDNRGKGRKVCLNGFWLGITVILLKFQVDLSTGARDLLDLLGLDNPSLVR